MHVTLGNLVRERIESEIVRFLDFKNDVEAGTEPEAIHQMRVAARRLRALFRAFLPILEKRLTTLEPELNWIAGSLGSVRDLDVIGARFPQYSSDVAVARKAKYETLRTDLRSDRFNGLATNLRCALESSTLLDVPLAAAPAKALAPEVVRLQFRRVRKLRRIGEQSEPQEVHKLRKRAKRLRYLTESFVDLYGKPAHRFLEELKGLQDILGSYQDDIVAAKILAELGCRTDLPRPSSAGMPGALSMLEKRWKKLARRMARERRALWIDSYSLNALE